MRASVLASRVGRDSQPQFAIENGCTGIILYGHSENVSILQDSSTPEFGSRYPHGSRAAL